MINISVKLNKNEHYGRENIDSALKRLKNKMDQEEIMETVRRKRSFETPKQIRVRKMKRMHKILKQNRASNKKQ
jgi:ribosomal protein S21